MGTNPFFRTDSGILLNGDSIRIMQEELEENSVDLIVTSPPYNVGISYDSWNDKLSLEEYIEFLRQMLYGFKKVLKDDGRFAINLLLDVNMKHTGKQLRLSPIAEIYHLCKEVGLNYSTIVSLQEDNPHRVKYTAWGSWLSASSPYVYNPSEMILIGYKNLWKKQNKGVSDLTKEEFMEIVGGIWKYRAETKKWTNANFSKDIPYKAIKGLSYIGDTILDPFAGSGTTLVVAEELNRKWIGIEISKEYCKVAKERLETVL